MPDHSLITQQPISPGKYERTKELRHNMTLSEQNLWSKIRDSRLGGFHFRRQQIIEPYIADFYCHEANLVIEVDGDVHNEQKEYDLERDQYLHSIGISVLHFSNESVLTHINAVIAEILKHCKTTNHPA
jgi:very-short-patch-repair endonuclease